MNIGYTESLWNIVAKTYGCKEQNRKVIYSFIDIYHSLCIDKKDIISAELEACERLLKDVINKGDRQTIEKEIAQLKMALHLMT
jgi:hypothetical protein